MLLALIEYQRKKLILESIQQGETDFGEDFDNELEEKLIKAFSNCKIKIKLKPRRKETADALKSKSNNNINPYVMIETNGSKKLVDIINHMALKLFKEEAAKIVLRLDGTQYSYMKCLDHQLMVQDLFLIKDTDTLEKVLTGHNFEETTL